MRYTLFFLLIVGTNFFGQNLVPNPSFENFTSCPTNMGYPCPYTNQGSYDHVYFWKNPICTSSDILCSCSNGNGMNCGVPSNFAGYQTARTGNAYAGLWCGLPNSPGHLAEYVCTSLTNSLTAGNLYIVSFYVSCGAYNLTSGTNGIGAYLSNGFPDTTGTGINHRFLTTAQVNNPANRQLTDTVNWTLICDTITAQGGENFITIGAFIPESLIVGSGAYLYVDDVSIIPLYSTGIKEYSNFDNSSISPNPTKDIINVKTDSDIENYLIQSTYGVNLNSKIQVLFESKRNCLFNLSCLEKGMYFVSITTQNGKSVTQSIILD